MFRRNSPDGGTSWTSDSYTVWSRSSECGIEGEVWCLRLTYITENKKRNIVNISPICPEAPHGRISTKFCTAVEVMDLITCDNFFSDRLMYVDFVGGQK